MSAIGAAISGGLGLLSGIGSNIQQTRNVKKQIEAQKEENEKTRQYNQMLAKQQNAWNVEQYEREQRDYLNNWNLQNQYDAPSAQMERLKAAGLNPNLALGSMTDSGSISTSSAAGSMTSGAPGQSTDMSALGRLPTVGDVIQRSLSTAMQTAQIDAIKAQTDKVKSETQGSNLDNQLKATTMQVEQALKQGELSLQNLTIKGLNFDVEKLKPEQLKQMTANINEMSATAAKTMQEVENLRTSLAGMELDNVIKKIDTEMHKPMLTAQIQNLASSTGLNIQQAREISKLLMYKVVGYEKSNLMADYNIVNAKGQYKKILEEVRSLSLANDRFSLELQGDVWLYQSSKPGPERWFKYLGNFINHFRLGK